MEYRVTMRKGTVEITRTVQADDSSGAILAAQDQPGSFWAAPLHIVTVEALSAHLSA